MTSNLIPEIDEVGALIRERLFPNGKKSLTEADEILFQSLMNLQGLLCQKPEGVETWEYIQENDPLLLMETFLLCHGQGYPCPSFVLDWLHSALLFYFNSRGKSPDSGKAVNLAKELGLVRGGHLTVFRERELQGGQYQAAFNAHVLHKLRGISRESACGKVAERLHEKTGGEGECPVEGVVKAYKKRVKKNKLSWDYVISKHRNYLEKLLKSFGL